MDQRSLRVPFDPQHARKSAEGVSSLMLLHNRRNQENRCTLEAPIEGRAARTTLDHDQVSSLRARLCEVQVETHPYAQVGYQP
jgi:hypothetical protein